MTRGPRLGGSLAIPLVALVACARAGFDVSGRDAVGGDVGLDATGHAGDATDGARDGVPCAWRITEGFTTALDPDRIEQSGPQIAIEAKDGYLEIRPASGVDGVYVAAYVIGRAQPVSLTGGGRAQVQVISTVTGNGAEMGMTVSDGSLEVNTLLNGGRVGFRFWRPPGPKNVQWMRYDATVAHWRIRQLGERTAVWETSPDGTSWTERRRAEVTDGKTGMDFSKAMFMLWGLTYQATLDPGVARFDSFEAAAGGCP